ncbi:MAG TPA: phage portal protein [Gemmatimonadales bacterium]|nr:phage portal protein [Gemmatimonadales bacterium]
MRNPLAVARRVATGPKVRAGYAAASFTRLTGDWFASALSADQELKGSLRTLRGRSRELERDNPHWAGLIAQLKNEIVGWAEDGIGMDATNKAADGTLLTALNQQLENAFERWGEPETCSADGQNSWGEMQRLVLGTAARDGECFGRRLRGFNNPYGYSVQLIDADLVDEMLNILPTTGQNEIRMGVEIDRWGRPVAYWVWTRAIGEGQRERVRIPADQMFHVFLQLRPGQTRGVPWGTPAMLTNRLLDKYTEAEVTQAIIAASAGGFFVTKGQDNIEASPLLQVQSTDKVNPDKIVMDAEPGLARALPIGMEFQEWDPTHPNANYAGFKKAILATIGRAVSAFGPLSYPGASGDLEGVNFSSGKMGLHGDRDGYRAAARWLTTRLHRIVYRDWVAQAQLAGAIRLPSFTAADWTACRWEYRGWAPLQSLEEIQAAEYRVKLGVDNRRRIAAEAGIDLDDNFEALELEQQEAKQRGIDVSGADKKLGVVPPPEDGSSGFPPKNTNGNGAKGHRVDPALLGAL